MSDEDLKKITIGDPGGDRLVVRVLGREYPDARDFGDGNWLTSMVEFNLGQFSGQLAALLRAEEFQAFRSALGKLSTSLMGDATLDSMEEWLTLRVGISGAGRLRVDGQMKDKPGVGNVLKFNIEGLDQSYLPSIIEEIDEVLEHFPVFDDV